MNARKKKALFPLSALALGAMLVGFSGQTGQAVLTGNNAHSLKEQNKFFADFTSLDEAKKAAAELDKDLAAEGNVLLKNENNVLPFGVGSYVSIFGTNAYAPIGGGVASGSLNKKSLTLAKAMESEGFHVNKALVRHYEDKGVSATSGPMSSGGAISDQFNDFDGTVKNSFKFYNDAAIVVLGRNAGEGSDVSRATGEHATPEDIQNHKQLANYTKTSGGSSDAGGGSSGGGFLDPNPGESQSETYQSKHALMLTEEERNLLKTAKMNFRKVVVLLNTSNVMEIGELKDDKDIQGILWIGRPGEDGLYGTARILSGEVNPSGHLVDEWPRDLTADPTWQNFGDNSQTGSSHKYYKADGTLMCNRPKYNEKGEIVQDSVSDDWTDLGVDYEEDIYNGYRYYQTRYEDMYHKNGAEVATQWYEDNVAYGFGDGLSYTKFSLNIQDVYKDAEKASKVNHALTAAELKSDVNAPAQVKKLYVDVKVKNTGNRAGKEVVQIYVKAPYTSGQIEKAAEDLVGYAKTSLLQPGETEVVTVSFNVQDFASWDYKDANGDKVKGDYELDAGNYTIRAMETSHRDLSVDADEDNALSEYDFTIDKNVHQHLDDFSDNKLSNLFTTDDGTYKGTYTTKKGKDAVMYNSLRTADMMADGADGDPEVLMSRADFEGTFPKAPKTFEVTKADGTKENVSGLKFKTEVYDTWQAGDISRLTYHPNKAIDTSTDGIRVNTALEEDDTQPWYIEKTDIPATWTQATDKTNRTINLKFKDLNGLDYDDPKYDEFLNQLTWDEITSLSTESRASTPALDDFGKPKSVDEDGPNDFGNQYEWCCEVTIASTWNTDLAHKEGIITGSICTLMGRTGWYGPGMDMHRSAFSGRNNEYYSQDALQGGYIAAAVVSGARSTGCNPMIKHLAFNDQETNRGGQSLYTWQSEQNIRQYELREFQMAIQEGGATAGMSAYGRICGVVNQSNWYLMTGFLQNECGWHGFMITDGFLGMRWCTTIDLMVRAGNGIVYKTEPWYDTLSGTWNPTLRDGKGDVEYIGDETKADSKAVESWNQYFYARNVAHSVLWSTVNSANYQNGFVDVAYTGKTMQAKVGTSFEGDVSMGAALDLGTDSSARYTAQGLPAGLTLNESSGKLSGTPSKVGTFNFEVTATIDNYITKTAKFTVEVLPAFQPDADSDKPSELKVGQEVMIKYESDVYTTEGGKYKSVKYQVKDGSALPAGLVISEDGTITGTPTSSGNFNTTIEVICTSESTGSFGGGTTTKESRAEFDIAFAIASSGEETEPAEKTLEEQIAELKGQIAQLKAQLEANATDTALSDKIQQLETKLAELEKKSETTTDQGGCSGSVVAVSSVLGAVTLLGAGLILKKKKEEK